MTSNTNIGVNKKDEMYRVQNFGQTLEAILVTTQ